MMRNSVQTMSNHFTRGSGYHGGYGVWSLDGDPMSSIVWSGVPVVCWRGVSVVCWSGNVSMGSSRSDYGNTVSVVSVISAFSVVRTVVVGMGTFPVVRTIVVVITVVITVVVPVVITVVVSRRSNGTCTGHHAAGAFEDDFVWGGGGQSQEGGEG